jgi:hypothetical protein
MTDRALIEALMRQGQIPKRLQPQGQPVMPGFEMLGQAAGGMPPPASAPSVAPQQASPVAAALLSGPERAAEAGMAHIRQNAGMPMGPDAPAPNPVMQYFAGIGSDLAGDPLGALRGLDAFGGLAGPMSASRTAFNPASREMARRDLRAYTEKGARQNTLDDLQIGARRDMEAKEAFARKPEVELSRKPHWEVQGKDANGHWQKLTPEAKAARERGIELRRREQEAIERARKYNEGAN